jgi:predicted porin
MNSWLIAAAVTASFASVACAQSSVTLYGLLDSARTYTRNVNLNEKYAAGSGCIDQSIPVCVTQKYLTGGL